VVDEFSTSAFIGVKKNGDKVKLVASGSKNVIKSVTGDSVLRIAESFGWETETREVCTEFYDHSRQLLRHSRFPTMKSRSSMRFLLQGPQQLWCLSSRSP